MPLIRPPYADRLLGPEGRRQQSETVRPLDPLAVVSVGFRALGGALHLAGIDEEHLAAFVLQEVVERDPIDTRGCHRHRCDLALPQPGSDGVQVGRARSEAADVRGQDGGGARGRKRRDGTQRNTDPSLGRPNIDASGVRIEGLE